MNSIKFIHTADWQIGMPSDFLTERASLLIEEARFEAIDTIREFANQPINKIDFVVICGDLFDDSRIGVELVERTLSAISLFDCPVYAIAGNHEVKGGEDILKSDYLVRNKPNNFIILEKNYIDHKTGVEIIPAPSSDTHQTKNPLADQLRILDSSERIRIALGHGRVDSVAYSQDSESIIKTTEIDELIKTKEIDYVALGDRHSFTEIGNTGKFYYSGSPEATDFNEIATGRIALVEITSKGITKVDSIQVGKWKLIRIGKPTDRYIIRSRSNVDSLRDELDEIENKAKTAIKIYPDIDTNFDTYGYYQEILDRAKRQFATVVERDGSERNVTPIISEDSNHQDIPKELAGYLRDSYEHLLKIASSPGENQKVALTALRTFKRILERST